MQYPAHIRYNAAQQKEEQTVADHCRTCAKYARESSAPGLRQTAYLAALLHDQGKYTDAFRTYITRAAAGEPVRRGSVNHTFAGVRFVLERWHDVANLDISALCAELIAFAIGSHHGLFDCITPEGKDGFLYRLEKEEIYYEDAKENFLSQCADTSELDELFAQAKKEVETILSQCEDISDSLQEMQFHLSFVARMLLSAVIDADRRDTAEFMLNIQLPAPPQSSAALWPPLLTDLENRLKDIPKQLEIDHIRSEISDQCRAAARNGGGIYRLSVPTGGGKTLASLRYALGAAANQKRNRIFFVIPLLSVLEQNAAVLRKFLAADDLILEHHSNLVREDHPEEELDEKELLTETWDAPIIITTLVQLLQTLFSHKTSCIRRMHALENSVIVIDEVQSVPTKLLSAFNMALNFLAYCCNATIVLCSATQPCLETVPHPLRYQTPTDLVPYDAKLWEVFRRTEIFDQRKPGGFTIEALADFTLSCLCDCGSTLVICNTKKQANGVYQTLVDAPDVQVFHLSTAMCMAHRIKTLDAIHTGLSQKKRIICVATQLVEAGVDFSFACVIRVSAGLDNVVQAAGRCNRGGEFGRVCPVYIVNVHEENLKYLKDIASAQTAAESVLLSFAKTPAAFNSSLTSEAAISAYYNRLYTDMQHNALDYPVPAHGTTLVSLLSDNRDAANHCGTSGNYIMPQAFLTAGSAFKVFDQNTQDVLVPYEQGAWLIAELGTERAAHSLGYQKQLLTQAKPYCISLYDYDLRQLQDAGGLDSYCDGAVLALRPDFYNSTVGFDRIGAANTFMEV